jgi:hypothetical protein
VHANANRSEYKSKRVISQIKVLLDYAASISLWRINSSALLLAHMIHHRGNETAGRRFMSSSAGPVRLQFHRGIQHVERLHQSLMPRPKLWAQASIEMEGLCTVQEKHRAGAKVLRQACAAHAGAGFFADEIAAGYGPDPYPYGIQESWPRIEAFCRYAHDQGVAHRRMSVDDLFPREVCTMARI